MATPPTIHNVRVGGSGFTIFSWGTQPIAFARQVSSTSPEPVAAPVAIQPLSAKRPIQVITPEAAGMGTIVVELYELYGVQVWEQLSNLAGSVDIVDIFAAVAALPDSITMTKYIKPPKLQGNELPGYSEEFHKCVITNVANGETIEVGTMELRKQITIAYAYSTRSAKDYTLTAGISSLDGGGSFKPGAGVAAPGATVA